MLVKDGPLKEFKVTQLPTCESCLEGKMTKRSMLSNSSLPKSFWEYALIDPENFRTLNLVFLPLIK